MTKKWHSSDWLRVWYEDKAEFKDEDELMQDLKKNGVSIDGEERSKLIYHLLRVAENFNLSSTRSPTSNVLSGVTGIGKTFVQNWVGKHIPKLYLDICVGYLNMNRLPIKEMNFDIELDLIAYCKRVSGKDKFLLLLDDIEAVFRPPNNIGVNFVGGLSGLCPPEKANIVVQVFGSSQVLVDLIRRNMSEKTAAALGFKGYVVHSKKLKASKFSAFYLYSPLSIGDVSALASTIANDFNEKYQEDDSVILTWYCSGIARSICQYYKRKQTLTCTPDDLLRLVWRQVSGDEKSRNYYHELAVQTGLINQVQTWQDLIQHINNNNMFDFSELVKQKCTQYF